MLGVQASGMRTASCNEHQDALALQTVAEDTQGESKCLNGL
jgi:hypothetical protein